MKSHPEGEPNPTGAKPIRQSPTEPAPHPKSDNKVSDPHPDTEKGCYWAISGENPR